MKFYRLLMIFWGLTVLLGCESERKSEDPDDGKSTARTSARERKRGNPGSSGRSEEASPSDSPKFAMNRNAETRALLTSPKPEGLILLKALSPSLSMGRIGGSQVRESFGKRIELSPDRSPGEMGTIKLPPSIASARWREAIISPGGSRVLMNPEDMVKPPSLYKVQDGALDDRTVEEIPNVNFDESRRWFIQWEGWLSDSKMFGVLNEDDITGHLTVRTSLYLYDVDAKELQRVDLPTGTMPVGDTFLEVVAVSDDAIVVNTAEGEKTLSLK